MLCGGFVTKSKGEVWEAVGQVFGEAFAAFVENNDVDNDNVDNAAQVQRSPTRQRSTTLCAAAALPAAAFKTCTIDEDN